MVSWQLTLMATPVHQVAPVTQSPLQGCAQHPSWLGSALTTEPQWKQGQTGKPGWPPGDSSEGQSAEVTHSHPTPQHTHDQPEKDTHSVAR